MKITTQSRAPAFTPFDVVIRVESEAELAALIGVADWHVTLVRK